MLYSAAPPGEPEKALIANIDRLCDSLRKFENIAGTWTGILARQAWSRTAGGGAVSGASLADPEPADPDGEDWPALQGYRRALEYGIRRSSAPSFRFSIELILALHFMITEHSHTPHAGAWRSEGIQVTSTQGEVVYQAPPAQQVPALMDELVESLDRPNDNSPLVNAALAHINMLRIHPFADGNGRMARCIHTLVLTREPSGVAEIACLEEYIGSHLRDYNLALATAGASWQPDRDTMPWIKFCLTAHYMQAIALFTKVSEGEELRNDLRAHLANREALPEGTLRSLGRIFGASPSVIARWWRMRPHGVIEHLAAGAHRSEPG